MSHFSVTVCMDDKDGLLARAAVLAADGFAGAVRSAVEHRLEGILAPYDENLEVDPYRDYEEGRPEDYWLYRSLKRADEDDRNGIGILPYKPDEIGWSSASSTQTPGEQRVEIARRAALFRTLPEPATWESVIDACGLLHPDDDDRLLVDEEGRAYRMSSRNPDSKWDYWRIGGRWGGYFTRKAGSDAASVILPEKGWDSPDKFGFYSCDAAPKALIDLAKMREKGAREAREQHEGYHAIVDRLPEGKSWAEFRAQVEAGTMTIGQARDSYHEQPRVKALRGTDYQWADDPAAEYGGDISVYAEKGSARAVTGFALVTTDGRWMAPGRMGWFAATDATDSTRIGYWEAANAYIDSLPDSAWLVAVDCHV